MTFQVFSFNALEACLKTIINFSDLKTMLKNHSKFQMCCHFEATGIFSKQNRNLFRRFGPMKTIKVTQVV